MRAYFEKPFEYLRRMDSGDFFGEETVRNWYIARAYVLERLKDIAFGPESNSHLHVVVKNDCPLMLAVVRQIALSAHYINYDESNQDESRRNRTVITLVSQNPKIKDELEQEEYLCNLPKYCKFVMKKSTMAKDEDALTENKNSFIDIEIHVVEEFIKDEKEACLKLFSEEDVNDFLRERATESEIDIFSIDTRKAVYANRIYSLGEMIDNLPAENIHSVERYAMALNIFLYEKLREPVGPLVNEDKWKNRIIAKEAVSNIYCADCFETRSRDIQLCANGNKREEKKLWEKYNLALSVSEHARWVVERLISGYSPLSPKQRFDDETLLHDRKKKTQFRTGLKKRAVNPAHIDLCSFADLRRINPADMKYDSFLMLAIPLILHKCE